MTEDVDWKKNIALFHDLLIFLKLLFENLVTVRAEDTSIFA